MNSIKEIASLIGAGVFTFITIIGIPFALYTIISLIVGFSFGRSVSIPGSFLVLVGLVGLYLCDRTVGRGRY